MGRHKKKAPVTGVIGKIFQILPIDDADIDIGIIAGETIERKISPEKVVIIIFLYLSIKYIIFPLFKRKKAVDIIPDETEKDKKKEKTDNEW